MDKRMQSNEHFQSG